MDDNWESIGMKSKENARNYLDQNIKVFKFIQPEIFVEHRTLLPVLKSYMYLYSITYLLFSKSE